MPLVVRQSVCRVNAYSMLLLTALKHFTTVPSAPHHHPVVRWLPRHAALVADLDAAHVLTEHFEEGFQSVGWPACEATLARAMWEAGSGLQLTRLECTGGLLERAGALYGMRSSLRDLVLTMQNGRPGVERYYCFELCVQLPRNAVHHT
jgi:hypothetical protein